MNVAGDISLTSRLDGAVAESAAAVDGFIKDYLIDVPQPGQGLSDAMAYAVLGPGKRLRPFLVQASAGLFNVAANESLYAAAALECIHAYSLVHDDLPAMDNDDLRRGRPTVHKAFDEATAILAGDGLLTLAFEILADPQFNVDDGVKTRLCLDYARSAGYKGMVGGQMMDLVAEKILLDEDQTALMQRMKTGALLEAAVRAGAILGGADRAQMAAIEAFGQDLGLAYQIADDLLDVDGDATETGKNVGKDSDRGKATFVARLGTQGARDYAQALAQTAADHLSIFGHSADLLVDLAHYTVNRRS